MRPRSLRPHLTHTALDPLHFSLPRTAIALFLILGIGLVGIAHALKAVLKRWNKYDVSFDTLHVAAEPAILPRASGGTAPGLSLEQLIRDSVPALGPGAGFDGAWWLPGYGPWR